MDVMLRTIEFDRYTLTPILALPAAVLSLAFWGAECRRARSQRDGAWLSVAAGGLVTGPFRARGAPRVGWAAGRAGASEPGPAGLPLGLATGALDGWARRV